MTQNRRIVLNIVATYGRSLYALAVGLFCGRWALMSLGEVDYGLLGVVGGLTMFVTFLNGVMANGVGRFYALSVGEQQRNATVGLRHSREWFTTAVIIHTLLPIFLMTIGYPIGEWAVREFLTVPPDRVTACVWVWRFTCVSCFVGMISVPYHAMYGAHQEIAELTIYSFVTTTLNVVFLSYMICHPDIWLVRYAAWTCVISVVPSLIITVRSFMKYKECRFAWAYINGCFDRIVRMINYCGWLIWGAVALLMKRQGVTVLVNKFFGPMTNTAMAIGNTLSAQCMQLSGSLEGAFWPAITTAYGRGDYWEFRTLAFRVSKLATSLILLFAIPLMLEVSEVLRLWLKNPPAQSSVLCVLAIVMYIVDKTTTGHCMAINVVGKVAIYQVVISAVLLLTLPASWLLLHKGWNVYSVGVVLIVTTSLATFVRLFFAKIIAGLSVKDWLLNFILPLTILCVVSGGFALLIRNSISPSFFRICIVTIIFLFLYISGAYTLILDCEERAYIKVKAVQIIRKILPA